MTILKLETDIEGLLLIQPKIFNDSRGYFLETYNADRYEELGLRETFVQDNLSMSKKGVLRGLHMQHKNPQGKLVSVVEGKVFDVAVDLRKGSPTYGKWHGVYLDAETKTQFYIPPGFAHGFLVLSEQALFSYKCTDKYYADDQVCVAYNDPQIAVKWPVQTADLILSAQDSKGLSLADHKAKYE